MKTILIEIRLDDAKVGSVVKHLEFKNPMTIEEILLTIGALENEKNNWLRKITMQSVSFDKPNDKNYNGGKT